MTTTVAQVATEERTATAERPDPAAGAALVTALPGDTFAELCARYQLEMDPGSVPELLDRFDLRFPGEPI